MARNKSYSSKLRRGKNLKQNKSVPNWIIMRTDKKVRNSPYSNREWRNRKLKRD
ncbi:MAG: 50S ribosomal protein L39e [Promethearchaeota archaeon]|nr:MAG: 50S ribosomal protein L39e [Candidatus Lokiarchaeota archaeon]